MQGDGHTNDALLRHIREESTIALIEMRRLDAALARLMPYYSIDSPEYARLLEMRAANAAHIAWLSGTISPETIPT